MSSRIIARFHPQAWQRDYAIDVDPEGVTEWDCTDAVLAMGREVALSLEDDSHESDALARSTAAPEWVRNWHGPFYVSVAASIREHFVEMWENG